MSNEIEFGKISYKTLGMLKQRGLVTHFLAYVAVFCTDEATAQGLIDQYIEWAKTRPVVPLNFKQRPQKWWVAKFTKAWPEFMKTVDK